MKETYTKILTTQDGEVYFTFDFVKTKTYDQADPHGLYTLSDGMYKLLTPVKGECNTVSTSNTLTI